MQKEYFKYLLLDANNKPLDFLKTVEGGRVSYSSLSRLKAKAEIQMIQDVLETIDINNKIRIIHHLNGIETAIGTFLISTPSDERNSHYKSLTLTCFSTLWYLDADKTQSRFFVPRGTNVINEIKRVVADRFAHITLALTESIKTTSTDREWEIGTPYLDIFNDLLDTINFTSLFPLADGSISAREYIVPSDRVVEHIYSDKDVSNKLEVTSKVELDYFNVPNIFVRYINDPDNMDMVARYENNNINSPTSTMNRPPNVDAVEVMDAADMDTLFAIAKRDCANATNKFHKVEFYSAINPNHDYMNCLHIALNGIDDKYIETSWEIECKAGGRMVHQTRKAVEV